MKFRLSLLVAVLLALGVSAFVLLKGTRGFSARATPSKLEALLAGNVRRLAMPAGAKRARNPVPSTPEVLREARDHFADHCASCHANDGSGDTAIGRGLYPKPPDMRLAATQGLSDGELFFVIQNGVRFTGMPAWGGDHDSEDGHDSWALVRFIRHLPSLTPPEIAEMEKLNPKSTKEHSQEEEETRFLEGKAPAREPDRHEEHRH